MTHQSWDFQFNYFGGLPQFSVLVFDNRGVGFSDAPRGLYTTADMAKDTLELLAINGWNDAHIVGISMGGMIAQEMAIQAPRVVRSLTLTSTHAGSILPPIGAIINIPQLILARNPKQQVDKLNKLIFPPHWLHKPSVTVEGKLNKQVMRETFLRRVSMYPPPRRYGVLGQLAAALSHNVGLDRLQVIVQAKIPVLVATGTWENLVHPSHSEYLAKALKARDYRVFQHAGHFIINELHEEYNQLLREFVQGVEAERTRELGKL
ncbi:Alpha/Beta hydrolase protein [Chytriomyces sp. MP71]|nr:Alpha/Beta hydrolase protein [Chytriomyces sp. MP71]